MSIRLHFRRRGLKRGKGDRLVADSDKSLDRGLKFREIVGPGVVQEESNDLLSQNRLGTVKLLGILRQQVIGDGEDFGLSAAQG